MAGTLTGGRIHGRDELATLSTPEASATWKPIPHHELVMSLIDGLKAHDITVTNEQYTTSGKDDAKLFGVLDLVIPNLSQPDYALCIGLRASNDRSMAIQATAGARVFVCSNMAFSGDSGTVVLKKRHTSRLDLRVVVPPAIDAYLDKANQFTLDIDRMKDFSLTDARAKEVIYDALVSKGVVPLRMLPVVHKCYFADDKQREMFPDRSLWSAMQAFTEATKQLGAVPKSNAELRVGRYFARVLNASRPTGVLTAAMQTDVIADEPGEWTIEN